MPISDRNPSAQVLSVRGHLFLIDCAEGTQQLFRKAKLSFIKIEAVMISHIHGDHVFGIFGLLSTLAMLGRTQDLVIYAPVSFGPILRFFLSYYGEGISFNIVHRPLDMKEPEVVLETKYLRVSAFPLNHKIECFGFRFDEIVPERRPDKPSYVPVSYAYCSDTAPFPQLPEWVRGVNVLYHEATYTAEYPSKAVERYHSTTADAARCALQAGAGHLLIGHYSSRIRDIKVFEAECQEIFVHSVAANDGDVFEITSNKLIAASSGF